MADRILFLETPDMQNTPVGEESNFTAAEKQKLAGIEAGAQKNTVDSVNGKTGPVTLDAADVGALPSNTPIPAAVTEQTVAGWGFTKNNGTYVKPVGGIPDSDIASAATWNAKGTYSKPSGGIPDSDIASAATWNAKGTYSKPNGGIPKSDLASDVQSSLGKADTALQSHQSLAAYRTATAQDTIDAAQDQAISGKLSTTGNAYRSASIPMGHLDSTSTATVMTATVDGITELRDGVCMWLRNGVITSASGFTLNVNGLGAKPCYSSLAAASRSTTIFNVNYTMLFVYNSTRVDGGCWDIVYGVDTNTTYTPVKLGFGYGTCTTAAATVDKTASISSYALTTGGIVSIKFDNDVPAGATLNITSKGAKAIYHRGAAITAGVIKAGDTATFVYSTYYHLISIDRDEAGSEDAPIQTVKVNGTALVPDANKSVDIPVPTVADVIEETVMVVQLTPTSTDLSGTMNRTGSEILAAYSAGKRIVAEVAGLNGSFEWNQAINGTMVTQFLYSSGGGRELIQVVAESGSSTVYHAYHIAQLPTVTASDNGKFLRVVSGAWAAQTVPSAESNSFGGGS